MAYTPPAGDNVDFTFSGSYTAPSGDDVDLLFGAVAEITLAVSTDQLFPGLNETTIRWSSSEAGPYRIELGGTGVTTGDLIKSGRCLASREMRTVITSSDITNATSYSGTGQYRLNVYVRSVDDIWSPYE